LGAEASLETRDLLLTVAEVATAFAGFASLAAVFANSSREVARMTEMRFQSMLVYSLATVAFCFVPLVPQYYDFSTGSTWQIASSLLAVGITAANLLLFLRNRGSAPTALPRLRLITWLALSWLPVALAGFGLLGVGAIVGNYMVALLAMLSLSAWSFFTAISSLVNPTRDDGFLASSHKS
jgi:hypothetical protein